MVASFAWGLGVATVFACAILLRLQARLLPAWRYCAIPEMLSVVMKER